MKCAASVVAIVTMALAAVAGAQSLQTVRLGEQDTCTVTGVTKIDKGVIRFDVSSLGKGAKVHKALLRMWVVPGVRNWGMGRWEDPAFDGFKVWLVPSRAEGQVGGQVKPLAVSYPFTHTAFACHEWDVTAAVKAWVADPAANKGLKVNFQFNANPAWRRPYLQVTAEGRNAKRPAQATDFKAFYRSGQVFMTWTNVAYEGAFFDAAYRIYAHDRPITAANLADATRLGEVHQLSQLNYRRSNVALGKGNGSAPGRPKGSARRGRINFVIDETWQKAPEAAAILKEIPDAKEKKTLVTSGPELSDQTGLFVHTVGQAGKVYFAVTAVVEGNENRQDFSAANALTEPIAVKAETPRPILQGVYSQTGSHPTQWREYVYWGGDRNARFHNEPSTPMFFVFKAPPRWLGRRPAWGTPANQPAWIVSRAPVAGYSSSVYGGGGCRDATVTLDTDYLPPTRLAPFAPAYRINNRTWADYPKWYFGAKATAKLPPDKRRPEGPRCSETDNAFGYPEALNTGRDVRKSVVRPYLETRRLFEIDYVLSAFPKADPNYVSVLGQSSGWLFGIHHAGKIAYINTAQECPWNSDYAWRKSMWVFAGPKAWGLKTPDGHNAWDYNDPIWYSKKFPTKAWPFISHTWADNYGGPGDWAESGYPKFYFDLAGERRAGRWWWCDIGDAPQGAFLHIPRNRAVPGLANCNFCEVPQKDWRKEPRGSLNGYIAFGTVLAESKPPADAKAPQGRPHYYRYDARNPADRKKRLTIEIWGALSTRQIDTPERFEMSLRIGDHGRGMNGQSVYPTEARYGKTDITLWRLQQFKVDPKARYTWVNRKVRTGQVLQSGQITADARGLLTVTSFMLDKDPTGNKLIITPAGGPAPKPDTSPVTVQAERWSEKLTELTAAEYARRCAKPEPWPVVRGRLSIPPIEWNRMTVYPVGTDGTGDFASDFQSAMDKTLVIPDGAAGRYRVTAVAHGLYGGGWGQLNVAAGGKYGRQLGWQVVDAEAFKPYTWTTDLQAGKIEFRVFNRLRYYAAGKNPELRKQKIRVKTVIFEKLDRAAKGSKQPALLRIVSPLSAKLAAGMPNTFRAAAWNAYAEPVKAKVAWSVAPAGASISVDGVLTAEKPGEYVVTAKVGGLADTTRLTVAERMIEGFDDRSTRGWWAMSGQRLEGGGMTDPGEPDWMFHGGRYHQQLMANRTRAPIVLIYQAGTAWKDYTAAVTAVGRGSLRRNVGLIVRFADAKNHVRFTWNRPAGKAALIAVKDGTQKILAETSQLPKAKSVNADRVRIEVRGKAVSVFLNDAPVFGKAVGGDLPAAGTIGLFADASSSETAFDNIEVKPLK